MPGKNGLPIHADDLRAMGDDVASILSRLDPKKAEELNYTWEFWARENQIAPEGDWNTWFINAGRGFGKAIQVDTPILTKDGWKVMGDVVAGDVVYDENGQECNVVVAHEPFISDEPYKITFSDGESLVACKDHLWVTLNHLERKSLNRKGLSIPEDWANKPYLTTKEIFETQTYGKLKQPNHCIPMAKPVEGICQSEQGSYRMIVSVERVQPCKVRCLTVDSKNSMFLVGRGLIPTHNTRAGVEWVRGLIKKGYKRVAAVASTNSDIERVMINGESGFLARCWAGDRTTKGSLLGRPTWSPTKRLLTWENGAYVQFFSAEEPERLRGPQFEAAWCDETAAWNKDRDTWDMLQFCLRLGKHPQVCVTTTPKPTKLVRDILKNPKTVVTYGSTFDNSANLAGTYLEAVKSQYEGTRLGRQELYAEILDEASGALWNRELLAKCEIQVDDTVEFAKKLNRVVVAVDPAVTSNAESDMTGIVVAGIDVNGICYVLEDATDRFTPEGWATKAVELYNKYSADRIVAERNQGGDMVRHTLQTVNETVPIRLVHASRGKFARAEPVSALYERGKVKHVRGLDDLEDQMVQWEPLGSIGSPDRLDSLVWSITDLALKGVAKPTLTLAYSDAKGVLGGSR